MANLKARVLDRRLFDGIKTNAAADRVNLLTGGKKSDLVYYLRKCSK